MRYLNAIGAVSKISDCHSKQSVRLVIVITNCVLRGIFETRERGAKHNVTRIVCWQKIALGWLDKGWEGKGRGVVRGEKKWAKEGEGIKLIMRCLLKNVDG
jgi:hypothetical protein